MAREGLYVFVTLRYVPAKLNYSVIIMMMMMMNHGLGKVVVKICKTASFVAERHYRCGMYYR